MGRYKGRTGSTGISCGGEMKRDHKKIKVNMRKCKFYLEKYPKKKACNNYWHDQSSLSRNEK